MLQQSFRILIITGALIPASLKAQKDFLLTNKGDTIRGQVVIQQNGNVEQAIVKLKKREVFSAMAVREIFMRGDRYKPVQFSGAVKFMKILNEGYLSLLAFQPPGIMNYDGRLLQMRDGRIMEVPTLGFKKHMKNFLRDDDPLVTKIDEGTLDRRELDQIINEYNTFISERTSIKQVEAKTEFQQKSKLDLLGELRTGIEQSELESKQEVLEMVTELEGKIKENKPAPPYLLKLIGDRLRDQTDLSTKFNELVKGL